MLIKLANGREVDIMNVTGKYEDDLCIDGAYYTDTDAEVSDQDLEDIYENHYDAIYELWFQKRVDAMDYVHD